MSYTTRALVGAVLIAAGASSAQAQHASLVLRGNSLFVRFQGPQIIGRAAACSLQLQGVPEAQHTQLSRLHAALVVDAGAWSVTDLGSTNGTFVNDKRLTPWTSAPLADGDQVGLGGFSFEFQVLKAKPRDAVSFDPTMAEKGCAAGAAADCAVLGVAYDLGIGVTRDAARARKLLQQACAAGYEPACRAPAR